MKISEKKLRTMIRSALMNEKTNLGRHREGGGLRLQSSEELPCPYIQDIPKKFATFFDEANSRILNPVKWLSSFFPNFKAELQENMDIKKIVEQLTDFSVLYTSVLGTPCIFYFYVYKIIDLLEEIEFILTGTVIGGRNSESPENKKRGKNINFFKGIVQKGAMLNRRSSLGHTFLTDHPYYILPNLHKKGPNEYDEVEFEKDLTELEIKLQEIERISSINVQEVFEEICEILEIYDTEYFRNLGEISQEKNREVASNLLGAAKTDLFASLDIAIKRDYNFKLNEDPGFKTKYNAFLSSRSV